MEEKICTLHKISKSYQKNMPSVLDISLDIYANEILGIRGANGAGKSTLMGILAGSIKADRGDIVFAPDIKQHIAFVPQELSLYEDLSGFDNLKFWGLALGMPTEQINIRIRWLLSQLNLFEKSHAVVSTYSGGMKRRLHFASALMLTPKLLLLDEALVGADDFSIELIIRMILHLKQQGSTIVMSSHDVSRLESVCNRIITMNLGQILEVKEYERL